MEDLTGADFAQLLLRAFDAMAEESRAQLASAGHAGLTVGNAFAVQAIDAGAGGAAELARALGVTRQAAAKTIAALEALGYVERTADAADARRKRLVITARGREAFAVGAAGFATAFQRWCEEVGGPTAAATVEALRALQAPPRR